MIKENLESLLALYSVTGIGSGRMRGLINKFGSAEKVLEASFRELIGVHGIDRSTATKIKQEVDEKFIRKQIDIMQREGISILSFWDKHYPERLKKIYDPPAFLFFRGNFAAVDDLAIAIVGTRTPSTYGRMMTEKFSCELAEQGLTIVSGLARGVDTIAHRAVLKHGGRTFAVLGSSLDQLYPPENTKLADRIGSSGVVLSEYPMDTKPDPGNFPRRNRIISGLSLGVLITEAGIKSGALITAFQALEQNREVFALPGPMNSAKSIGTNRLIKEGAILVQSTEDIISELEGLVGRKKGKAKSEVPALHGLESTVYTNLDENPSHVDSLVQKCNRTSAEVLSVLLTLELRGLIKQLSGKLFIRI